MIKWKPPKHGDDSKYIHVRLRSPTMFTKMRTINLGDGVKQVYGKVKGKKQWRPQNIMIPVNKVTKRGSGINIKTKKMKKHLSDLGIQTSKIKRMKTGGSADYVHPAIKKR